MQERIGGGRERAAARVEAVRSDIKSNLPHANSNLDRTQSLMIEVTGLPDGARAVSYIQLFNPETELPRYRKNWERFDVQPDTIGFVPLVLPDTPGEFETLLRHRCRIDRDRLLKRKRVVSLEEARCLLPRLDTWKQNNTLDRRAYLHIVAEMGILFRQDNRLAEETIAWLNAQHRYRSATSWEGKHAWWLMDARSKGYMVTLRTDLAGNIDWLFVNYPSRPPEFTLHPDELRILIQVCDIDGYHGISAKGYEIFTKGRRLPAGMRQLCAPFLKDGVYTFYSQQSQHRAAHAALTVNGDVVERFDAVEAHFSQ
jgi:hypothetical protein